jgi:hypothetical protein
MWGYQIYMVPTKLIGDFLYSNQLCCDREPTGTSFISVWFQLNHLCIRYDRIVATTFGGSLYRATTKAEQRSLGGAWKLSATVYIVPPSLSSGTWRYWCWPPSLFRPQEKGKTVAAPYIYSSSAGEKGAYPYPIFTLAILHVRGSQSCPLQAHTRAFFIYFPFFKNEKGEYIPRPAGWLVGLLSHRIRRVGLRNKPGRIFSYLSYSLYY